MGVLPDWAIERDIGIIPFATSEKREGKISYGCGSYGYDVRLGYKFKVFSPINATEIDPKNFDPNALVEVDLTPQFNHEFLPPDFAGTIRCQRCGAIPDTPSAQWECPKKPNYLRIPPHSFVLAESLETFKIPRDVLCIVLGKSTYARCGLVVNVTPGEPEWEGKWTIELSNTTPLPLRIYAGEGIAQCLFLRTDGQSEAIIDTLSDYLALDDPEDISLMRSTLRNRLRSGTCKTSYADKKGKYNSQLGLTLPKVD